MDNQKQTLTGFQRAEFKKASRLQIFIIAVQLGIAGLTCVALLIANDKVTYLLSLGALLLAITWGILNWQFRKTRNTAERARRVTVLIDAFGAELPSYEYTDLLLEFTVSEVRARAEEDPNYYSTNAAAGLGRLVSMIDEAAFWSCELLSKSAKLYWSLLLVTFVVLVVSFLALVSEVTATTILTSAKFLGVIATAMVSADFMGAASSYSSSARDVEIVSQKLRQLDSLEKMEGLQAVFILWGDYNSAVESAPLFAPTVYRRNRDRLNRLWGQREHQPPNDH